MYQAPALPDLRHAAPPTERLNPPILVFGILFPLLTILVEATLHPLRSAFCDPLATPLHWLACFSVPGLLLWGWFRPHAKATPFTAAFALTVSCFYGLTLFPVLVFGLIALILGVGILPLAPILTLLTASRQLYRCRQFRRQKALAGMAAAVLLLAVGEAPAALVRQAIAQGQVTSLHRAIPGFSAHLGSICAESQSSSGRTPLEGWMADRPVSAGACTLMYRLTGEVPAVKSRFDQGHGGIATGAPRADLSLVTSSLDGGWQPGTPVAQLRWDLEFRNDGFNQEEARFRVALPPQGVVNGVTLWVDGEPREAAFGGTSAVRDAYRKVAIVQRRDPLLVTWAGPNEVFVQCFPVPAHGTMRIRLAIAAPALTTTGEAAFPGITEHNFGHSLATAQPRLARASLSPVNVQHPLDPAASLRAEVQLRPGPRELFVVIDGSAWMSQTPGLDEAVRTWRQALPVRVWLAGETPREAPSGEPLRFAGGADNVPALSRALSAAGPDTWVLWIHGRQPFVWASPIPLETLAKRPGRFLGYRVGEGTNEVWNMLARAAPVELLPHLSDALNTRSWKVESVPGPAQHQGAALAAVWASAQPAAIAQRQRVITREVGAVVLERQQQYDENGLETPPDTASTETPEPATWLTIGTAVLALLWCHHRRRHTPAGPRA